jgi:hypothetical protein
MSLDTPGVKCRARSTNYGDPIDCEWPFCGCDERAEKVVQSLHECGWEDGHPLRSAARSLIERIDSGSNFKLELERLRELINA